jgi:uncharacterized protein
MQVPPVRHPSALSGTRWQHIPLDEGDGVVELRNNASGKQSSHAATKDDGSIPERAHPTLLAARYPGSRYARRLRPCDDVRVTATPDSSATDSRAISMLAGYQVTSPPVPRPVLARQRWGDLTFVHWPVQPESVADMYPPGTRPDVFADGMTYVALVPFAMSGLGLGTAPPIPYFGTFLETDIWLYSTDDDGRHGVLMLSVEAARLGVVPFARIAGLPFTWARMRMTRSGGRISYHSVRRWPRPRLGCRLTISVGELVEPTPLEVWLTARWGAHIRAPRRTWWSPQEHEPWPLRAAEIIELDEDLLGDSGVQPAGAHLRALFSPGVRSHFGRPTLVR